ncbi:MAG: DUF1858 domain-containing protein [Bacillota bacterium]
MEVTKNTYILDLLTEYPTARDIFADYGMKCSSCLRLKSAQIKDVARSNDLNLEFLVADLNKLVEREA